MKNKKKRTVIALGGNTLSNTFPEQMIAVETTAKATVDLIEEGCEVIVVHGNGPQVGMINNTMAAPSHEDANQPNTPLSICVTMNQACIGCDFQNASGEELYNHEVHNIPATTMITQVRADTEDPAFNTPSRPIGHFMTEEQARIASERYGYIMKEDAERGYRCVVASPKPAEIVEISAARPLVGSDQLVIAYGGDGIPAIRQGNHLRGASAVIDKGFASELLTEELNTDFLIILTIVGKVAINFGKPEEKRSDNLTPDQAHVYVEEGHLAPGSMLPKVQVTVKFVEPKDGRTALITLLEKAKEGVQGLIGTHIHR